MKIIEGDLLSVSEGILVHGCNCQGVMGGGIAALIRKKYPGAYDAYKRHEQLIGLQEGDVSFAWNTNWKAPGPNLATYRMLSKTGEDASKTIPSRLIVANALTQHFYGGDKSVRYVSYDAVFAAFARIRQVAKASGLSVKFPMIGAGLANGDWAVIEKCIQDALGDAFEDAELWVLPGTTVPGHVPSTGSLF